MNNLIKFTLCLLAFTLCLLSFHKCDNSIINVTDYAKKYDSLNIEFKKLQNKSDSLLSLSQVKDKTIDSLKSIKRSILKPHKHWRDSVIVNICDTSKVLQYYDSLSINCERMDSINNQIISRQDENINILKDVIKNQQDEIQNRNNVVNIKISDTEELKDKNKTLTKELKKERFKRVAVSVVALIATTTTLFLSVK